jgi:hypothetical protein
MSFGVFEITKHFLVVQEGLEKKSKQSRTVCLLLFQPLTEPLQTIYDSWLLENRKCSVCFILVLIEVLI